MVVSINERDVPIELIEKISVVTSQIPEVSEEILQSPYIQETVVLSTCLRTEIYAFVNRFHDGLAFIENFFRSRCAVDEADKVCEHLKVYFEEAAAEHLFAVASGIDSPVLGEGEILRQVKHAWEMAQKTGACGANLSLLFRHAIATGKKARSMTTISQGITSLAHIAVELASQENGGNLQNSHALVVGAGEMGSKIVSALADKSISDLSIANRGQAKAKALAQIYDAKVIDMSNLYDAIKEADVVLTALVNDEVLITREIIEEIIASRSKPMVLIDTAVPRAIDPGVKDAAHVKLFNIDDLRLYAEKEFDLRRSAIVHVEEIIAAEMERYFEDARGRQAAPLIKLLRLRAFDTLDKELAKNQIFASLDPSMQEEIRKAFVATLDKFLHEPTIQIKKAVGTSESEILFQSLRTLFGL